MQSTSTTSRNNKCASPCPRRSRCLSSVSGGTGIGIAPDAIERIFDAFAQASHETTMRFGGTGLGLTITRRLLALYGSTVQVQSTQGEGSTFSFTLRLPLPASPTT